MLPGPVEEPTCKRAAELTAARGVELVEQLPLEREHPLRPAVERVPGLGRLDAPPGAVEQPLPKPFLERANLEAHRGLRDAQPLRGLREALPLDDRAEGGQLTRVHKLML